MKCNFKHVYRWLFRKPVNKNAWHEEEQNELRELFEEFKDSEGIIYVVHVQYHT